MYKLRARETAVSFSVGLDSSDRRSRRPDLLLLAILPDQPGQVTALAVLHDDVEHRVGLVDEALDVADDVVVLVEVLENVAAAEMSGSAAPNKGAPTE